MNNAILENAAIYVNSYRASAAKYGPMDVVAVNTLRNHVIRLFGAVYAAVLVQ